MTNPRVMPRGNFFCANLPRGQQQLIELHVIVAKRARDWSAPLHVVVHERADDRILELPLKIDHVVWNAEMLGDAARVMHVVMRAAAMLHRSIALKLRQAA